MALSKRKAARMDEARQYLRNELAKGTAVGEIERALDLKGMAVAHSTIYSWAKVERQQELADKSGPWLLATDDTGRPDLILRILHVLFEISGFRRRSITRAEARWCVRIATAVPDILLSAANRADDPEWHLFHTARKYVRAEGANDVEAMTHMDLTLANIWTSTKWRGQSQQETTDAR